MTGGLWGYADTSGTAAVAARFLEAGPFSHGLGVVRGETGGRPHRSDRRIRDRSGPPGGGPVRAVVRELLDRPPREFYPTSLIFDDNEDPYDRENTEQGAMLVIASVWPAAEWLTECPWLEDSAQAASPRSWRRAEGACASCSARAPGGRGELPARRRR
ncbi:WG repeat-containing protein [Streptomyces avidinii]|uniref:WG repeat-containing protein n=1 Tax=Streptomyces avidinii TaxID=1895 RepID=UPI0037B24401